MIGDHVYVFFTFFGPDLGEKEEDKRRSIFARASAILFTVDITHMRMLYWSVLVQKTDVAQINTALIIQQDSFPCIQA